MFKKDGRARHPQSDICARHHFRGCKTAFWPRREKTVGSGHAQCDTKYMYTNVTFLLCMFLFLFLPLTLSFAGSSSPSPPSLCSNGSQKAVVDPPHFILFVIIYHFHYLKRYLTKHCRHFLCSACIPGFLRPVGAAISGLRQEPVAQRRWQSLVCQPKRTCFQGT